MYGTAKTFCNFEQNVTGMQHNEKKTQVISVFWLRLNSPMSCKEDRRITIFFTLFWLADFPLFNEFFRVLHRFIIQLHFVEYK